MVLLQVFDIFRARELDSRYVCEYRNNCDRPEVFDPPAAMQKPKSHPNRLKSRVAVPDNAIKVAMVTDVHVEPRYSVVRHHNTISCHDGGMQ